jgi:hypothetical protein
VVGWNYPRFLIGDYMRKAYLKKRKSNQTMFQKLITRLYNKYANNHVIGIDASSFPQPSNNELHTSPKLNFKIFAANGGYILEFYKYDYKKDETASQLYVISSSEELTESITMICQREFLTL